MGAVQALEASDQYDGWIRLGMYEDEIRVDPKKWSTDSVQVIGLRAGVCTVQHLPPGTLPFREATERIWFQSSSERLPTLTGPLLALSLTDGPLGNYPILGFTSRLAATLDLYVPGRALHFLSLDDHNGNEAARLRTWSVGPSGDRLSEQAPRLSGCDFIVRPDVWEQLQRHCSQNPLWHTVLT
jgi:hypothetical protein